MSFLSFVYMETMAPTISEKELKAQRAIEESVGIDMEANEHIFMVIRKHWIYLVITFLYLAIVCTICGGIYVLVIFAGFPTIFAGISSIWMAMFGILYVFIQWINTALDMLVVTNRRIIVYDQVSFLRRKLTQTNIELVTEVNAETSGLVGNILLFGTIIIKTASDSTGEKSNFDLELVPKPLEVSRTIHNFIYENRDAKQSKPL